MITTACPLDCWDACAITVDPARPDQLVPTPSHPMHNGALCALTKKHFFEAERITQPRVDGRTVSLDEALDAAAEALRQTPALLWRGSGNLGVMQGVTDLLMERIGGTLTHGSLCDGAGQAGVAAGRGINRMLPPEQIARAEVVVVWGRNLNVTNKHLLPFIENKILIVIDPVRTTMAKRAHIHLQVKPRSDFYLAILLARFAIMEGAEDTEWLEEHAPDWEEFYEFTREFRIKAILEYMGLSLDQMGDMLHLISSRKTVFLVGTGLQHHAMGHATLWAIDSLAAVLGLFGREGCGVSFMGNSRQGFDNPFATDLPRVSMVTTPFERFKTVLVQGGNPAESMPDSTRVQAALEAVENLIYFGLYENETSARARIVIPARTFLAKEDLRLSYGHHYAVPMHKVYDDEPGIDEYSFVQAILARLGLAPLESESYYLDRWKDQCDTTETTPKVPDYDPLPYAKGFGEADDEPFTFIDEYEDDDEPRVFRVYRKKSHEDEAGLYWLLTPKHRHGLNTQFERGAYLFVPPEAGIEEGQTVRIENRWGWLELEARISDDLRSDCVMAYAGTPGINRLTPPYASQEGEGACYGESRVKIERISSK
jgi:anaerobic selenocysteine-containing dehydrogenase